MKHADPKTQMQTPECPACSHTRGYQVSGQIYRCGKCDAIHGTCYLGESYTHVLPYWVTSEPPAEQTRYFDFTCLGSAGITRRHGWYDTATKRIVQVG
jgi:hypothetical protein